MSGNAADERVLGSKALEVVMRDVLCGLEDLACVAGYQADPRSFSVLSIERPGQSAGETEIATQNQIPSGAEVVDLGVYRSRLRQRRRY